MKDEIHITGSIRLEKDVTLTIEPGTPVYIASNSNDQHSGWSADDEYTRKYNDPVRLESWSREAILIDGRGVLSMVSEPRKNRSSSGRKERAQVLPSGMVFTSSGEQSGMPGYCMPGKPP